MTLSHFAMVFFSLVLFLASPLTRRSRSDVIEWVTESVSVSTDLTDVTLVNDDTY